MSLGKLKIKIHREENKGQLRETAEDNDGHKNGAVR